MKHRFQALSAFGIIFAMTAGLVSGPAFGQTGESGSGGQRRAGGAKYSDNFSVIGLTCPDGKEAKVAVRDGATIRVEDGVTGQNYIFATRILDRGLALVPASVEAVIKGGSFMGEKATILTERMMTLHEFDLEYFSLGGERDGDREIQFSLVGGLTPGDIANRAAARMDSLQKTEGGPVIDFEDPYNLSSCCMSCGDVTICACAVAGCGGSCCYGGCCEGGLLY